MLLCWSLTMTASFAESFLHESKAVSTIKERFLHSKKDLLTNRSCPEISLASRTEKSRESLAFWYPEKHSVYNFDISSHFSLYDFVEFFSLFKRQAKRSASSFQVVRESWAPSLDRSTKLRESWQSFKALAENSHSGKVVVVVIKVVVAGVGLVVVVTTVLNVGQGAQSVARGHSG